MQVNFEQAIEIIKTLPPEDFRRLDEWIEERKRQDIQSKEKEQKLKDELEQYKKARNWIDEHREEYMNQWVCLEGDQLVSHGLDGMKVHRTAKESGIVSPFMVRIIEEPENFVGAWL